MKNYMLNDNEFINSLDYNFEGYWKLDDYLSLKYHEKSKYDQFGFKAESAAIAYFASPYMVSKITKPYKCYPGSKVISFDNYVDSIPEVDIFKTILYRRSQRVFSEYKLSLSELYQLLYYSYGITGRSKLREMDGYWDFRAVPSGGGLYPLEIYVFINNSIINQGLYHYRPDINSIELLSESLSLSSISHNLACDNIDVDNTCCIIFISSLFLRSLLKYGERGYRFIMQEVGFVSENLSLISAAIGLSTCMLGGYIDDEINKLLGIDGSTETIQNLIVLGKSKTNDNR